MKSAQWSAIALACCLSVIALRAGTGGGTMPTEQSARAFDSFADQFFEAYFQIAPSARTVAGFHAYDRELEDFSRRGIAAAADFYRKTLSSLDGIKRAALDPDRQGDDNLIRGTAQSALLDLESVRMWEANPDQYTSGREAKRGASDPTYLVYTMGKLQFLKLRADYRARVGASFNLREFHDACMRQGFPPVRILRRALLGEEGSVL